MKLILNLNFNKYKYLYFLLFFILFLAMIYFCFSRKREGFEPYTHGPYPYSEDTIKKIKAFAIKQHPNTSISDTDLDNLVRQYSIASSETEINAYIDTGGIWTWNDRAKKQMRDNTLKSNPKMTVDELDKAMLQSQSMWPQTTLDSLLTNTGLLQIASKNHMRCNLDPSGNVIGDGLYKLDASNKLTTEVVDNKDLPVLIPGFAFLDEPCNPCMILSSQSNKFSCPFALPGTADTDKAPILPNSYLLWLWGISTSPAKSVSSVAALPSAALPSATMSSSSIMPSMPSFF